MNDRGRKPQRVTLFQSKQLEALTLISAKSFAILWALGLPLIALAGWNTTDAVTASMLVFVGLLVWILTEYVAHRFLFHWDTNMAAGKWLVFLMHGNHHVSPNDPLRNLMPPIVSIPVGLLVGAICVALVGPAGTWILLGFMSGYVAYDAVHYACHQASMRGSVGQALKRHHMRHHHIDEAGNYAITAIFLDYLFGSAITSVAGKSAARNAARQEPPAR